MLLDAGRDRDVAERIFDICIIGAGPAGITLARKLGARGLRVALMEAGGEGFDSASQDIYAGTNSGLDYWALDFPRLRFFGGSSNHWAGWSRPLDAMDFEARAHVPMSGWPFSKTELDTYAAETDTILELPERADLPPLDQLEPRFTRFQMRYSPPVLFGEKYREEISGSENILCFFNANLVDLEVTGEGGRIAGARFRTLQNGDQGFLLRARHFCLATGGIENARLLLNFDRQVTGGIGNQNGQVGRTFCEHPHFVIADMLLEADAPDLEFYRPTPEFAASAGTLNFGLRLEPQRFNQPGAPPREDIGSCEARLPQELRKVLGHAPSDRMRDFLNRSAAQACPTATLRIAFEQALNPESRVRLGSARDALGLRRSDLHWQLSDLDMHTMRAAAIAFGTHLAEQGRGRLRLRDWLTADPPDVPGIAADEVGGKHHMCTTRMSANPQEGVVDADCRVHGVENLFVAGSSVFPTGGHSNPTYTIIQLTLRLADHLAGRI
ncbi:GMC family oxidoreductase [Sulfitobacter sp. D35]|uniref:GMC family oxidoreductase n=1 Tax=Sulfitobacter sp. D35 TaxID=3083252 RepID=UPI00296FD2BF|nr:GMC family oxidoreductase [Sulfitobacter sp. D35]MDW4496447.1 GMC family oxidoreductase [Sulfitobacter sp. D35]